ncbi:MAG: hypothetical protein U9N53_07665 [Bacteroidota bacterium]|nr:hypothetical protein [Bacteroidota bacterium]
MEDSISTIIYLVITFVILAASFLKKKKKTIPKTVSSESFESLPEDKPETKSPKKGIEGFLNTLLEEQSPFAQELDSPLQSSDDFFEENEFEEEWEEKKEVIEPKTKEGVSIFTQDDPNTVKIETGLLDSMATQKIEVSGSTDEEIELTELNTLVEDFEIKKAIIYSEILNPKYF